MPRLLELGLVGGKKVFAKFYLFEMETEGKVWPVRVASFESAIPVIGFDTLEGLEQKKFVPTRGNYARIKS